MSSTATRPPEAGHPTPAPAGARAPVILVLGATSAIAAAYCRRRAATGARFVLAARQEERLASIAADLEAHGAGAAATVTTDLSRTDEAEARFRDLVGRHGTPDEVLLAYGILGDQTQAEGSAAETRRILDVNFTSAAVWLQLAAAHMAEPGGPPRTLIVIGSVAGDRGRRSNYVYGAAKAGLDAFAEGLAHRLHGTNLRVLTVKPGPVDTPMTAHMDRSGPLWAKPEAVAAAIEAAVGKGRRVLYAPWFWRPIMTAIRFAPRALFYRTKL